MGVVGEEPSLDFSVMGDAANTAARLGSSAGAAELMLSEEIATAADPDAHREMIEQRLLRLRSPIRAAQSGDVVDLIDPRDTRRLACTFVRLAQPALDKLAQRPKRAVRP